MADETVGDVAELYLGNILYAIELAAMSLQEQRREEDAAFYRAIARQLAEARGRAVEGTADRAGARPGEGPTEQRPER